MILESRPPSSLAGTAVSSRRGSPFANNDTTAFPPPPPGTTELYERLVQVGEGTYGKVYKARNVETNVLVAMKRIRMEAEKDGFPVTAIREIKLLQSLRHPNVVDLVEMMVSKGHVYMVFEYIHHDLTGVLHHPTITFTPAHLKSLMKQFLEGLGFIHRRGVLHRDLKGSNILIGRNGELKIADFGLARFYARGRKNDYTNRVITQWYKPPELLFGATVYGAEVDMWSAGCIFLELFARRPVFQGQDEIHQLEVIFKVTGTPDVESWPSLIDLPWYELVKPQAAIESKLRETFSKWLTPAGLDLAEALLSLNPAGRPDSDAALRMPYFTKEAPRPEMPDVLQTVKGEWHEYESKLARKKHRDNDELGDQCIDCDAIGCDAMSCWLSESTAELLPSRLSLTLPQLPRSLLQDYGELLRSLRLAPTLMHR
ncbi:kinase-like domain-containing protein [Leucosporidium creatinivorum]|uniref:[RNA-polymerase]-subunit kinase n=1 Tax=Leucosporidium creatinivorum TaxID=106004 RepID=A0A1Y2EZ88_9BASI|nr:kinase-like domain-containing protein [Leucosporidium creatinivorum]